MSPRSAEPIDEGAFVPIRGVEQWITLRGRDRRNPVLLLLHGPGFGFSPMAPLFAPWEAHFTLAQWDQPGAGWTHAKNGEAGTGPLGIDRLTRDAVAVVEFLRARLGAPSAVVLGVSGGSIIGLRVAKQRPDLLAAYVGNGQIVNWARQEALCYETILARARAAGDAKAIAELEQIGPPPWRDIACVATKSKYANALTPVEQAFFASLGPAAMAAMGRPPADASYVPRGVAPVDSLALSAATFAKLWPETAAFDARALGLDFEVPMFFFQGELDAHMVTSEVQAYAAEIRAPRKALELIKGAGHMSTFLRDDLLALLLRHVGGAS